MTASNTGRPPPSIFSGAPTFSLKLRSHSIVRRSVYRVFYRDSTRPKTARQIGSRPVRLVLKTTRGRVRHKLMPPLRATITGRCSGLVFTHPHTKLGPLFATIRRVLCLASLRFTIVKSLLFLPWNRQEVKPFRSSTIFYTS